MTGDRKPVDPQKREGIGRALGRIPSGLFILTARHEDRRMGMMVSWVQQVSFQPPMVMVAVAKGRAIMPLVSESRRFGLCQLPRDDKLVGRKFASGQDMGEDPFLGLDLVNDTSLGVPILAQSLAFLECEVACHVDFDGDHDLFIGLVRGGRYLAGEPQIRVRDHGFAY